MVTDRNVHKLTNRPPVFTGSGDSSLLVWEEFNLKPVPTKRYLGQVTDFFYVKFCNEDFDF